MIFLMSVFAVYCGLLYNDFFALGLNLFGSKYIEVKSNNPEERHVCYIFL
jgi:V-type H+-transporting ATPase subunit a